MILRNLHLRRRHAITFAVAALASAVSVPYPAWAPPIEVKARAVPLDARDPTRTEIGKFRYRGGLALSSPEERFGGLSGLAISRDGNRLLAISDKGFRFAAQLMYGADGNLVGIAAGELDSLADLNGRSLHSSQENDAEAMAVGPSGEIIVAFERHHRLWRYLPNDPVPEPLPPPPGLERAPSNQGIEALTFLEDGRLLAITEGLTRGARNVGWISDADGWSVLTYVVEDGFLPTDAALLPSGDVVVLERYFAVRGGLGVRVRRVAKTTLLPGAELKGELLAEFRQPLTIDNMEGIAARRDERGRTLVYLIADDNYNPLQRTLLLLFELIE